MPKWISETCRPITCSCVCACHSQSQVSFVTWFTRALLIKIAAPRRLAIKRAQWQTATQGRWGCCVFFHQQRRACAHLRSPLDTWGKRRASCQNISSLDTSSHNKKAVSPLLQNASRVCDLVFEGCAKLLHKF